MNRRDTESKENRTDCFCFYLRAMKKLIELITAFSLLAGIWITVYGLMISSSGYSAGTATAISGAVIFGASLLGAIVLLKDSKR